MFAIVPLVLLTNLFGAAQDAFRNVTLDDALLAAGKEKKVVLVDFFTTWCGPCKKLDATTWKDPSVIAWIQEKCVAVKLDAEKNAAISSKYRVAVYPTLLLLDASGSEIDRLVGYKDGATFLGEATDALNGKDGIARAKEKLIGHEQDPMLRGRYAAALALRGRYEEALAEYLWCFDHGATADSAYSAVRVSFLLNDIKRLGETYPPAIQALETRRDAAESRIRKGSRDYPDLDDALTLNDRLGTNRRSVALFDELRKDAPLTPALRTLFERRLMEPLWEAKRYADMLGLLDDAKAYVEGKLTRERPSSQLAGTDKEFADAMAAAEVFARSRAVTECSRIHEALLATDRRDEAARVADMLLEFQPNAFTYTTLMECADRARAVDVARSIAQRGLKSLPEADHKAIERTLKRIERPK